MATITTAPAGADALLGLYKRAPIELVRGEGVELFDADDRAYLDFTSGIGVLNTGQSGRAILPNRRCSRCPSVYRPLPPRSGKRSP